MLSVSYSKQVKILEVRRNVQSTYYELWYQQNKQQLWRTLDSFYQESARIANLRVKTGESAGLDSISANAKSQEVNLQLKTIQNDIQAQQTTLRAWLNIDTFFLAVSTALQKVDVEYNPSYDNHPSLLVQKQAVNVAQADLMVARRRALPEFSGRFFSQRLYGLPDPYSGFSVTMGVPLLGAGNYRSKVKAARLETEYQQTIYDYDRQVFSAQIMQLQQALAKNRQMLDYYESSGLRQADAIMKAASIAYRGGEISFAELSQYLNQAIDIRKNYLDALNQFNQNAIQLNYYLNR